MYISRIKETAGAPTDSSAARQKVKAGKLIKKRGRRRWWYCWGWLETANEACTRPAASMLQWRSSEEAAWWTTRSNMYWWLMLTLYILAHTQEAASFPVPSCELPAVSLQLDIIPDKIKPCRFKDGFPIQIKCCSFCFPNVVPFWDFLILLYSLLGCVQWNNCSLPVVLNVQKKNGALHISCISLLGETPSCCWESPQVHTVEDPYWQQLQNRGTSHQAQDCMWWI